MSAKVFDGKTIDNILEKMIETVEGSKKELFQIGEQSRHEFDNIREELKEIRRLVYETIEEVERIEVHERFARMRLTEVSRHFDSYSETEVRDAYEKAHTLNLELSVKRQQEQQLRQRRDDLERRLRNLQDTIERADVLVGQVSIVLNYLSSDIRQMNELIEDAKQKQEFGLKIIEAQEEERRRLSREIHDGPAQMLANVMMRSDLVDRVFREQGADDALKEIKNMKNMVRSALYEVRKIIYDLRPMALDDLGLVPTLKRYLNTIKDYNKLDIEFNSIGKDKRLPRRLEVALFRLVQEAVQNSCKHAEPSLIQVKMQIAQKYATMVIKDDGKGFDTSAKKNGAFGLIGMKERIELLEGELTIDSKLGKGTVIIIQVPLEEKT
ncbi:sensor histidine kinase [Bacillus solimangrovi]|uniref:Signal transduction histidine-protein kinase/phosphatase DegS n=1 Tax=Bacillus solimangrovi TaxID=1305675 RepID=A0A1E5LDM8_9BACI|nr:sensor histidine kinase [Bacillus solimangrovi]OEH92187.1 histidine kinase [Bacillus solimangrovi]